MPGDQTTGFNIDCRKRVDTFYFHMTDGVERSTMLIAYRQDIIAIAQQHGLRKLLVTNRKKYKPAGGDELGQ